MAIIGHNGCGKSTFFRSLINQNSFQGEIVLNGERIETIPNLSARGFITLLEQKNIVGFSVLVRDLILMGRFRFKSLFDEYTTGDLQLVDQALATLEISHLRDQDFLKLSGGEQQLVWLAQVMVQETDIVLLDEPTQQLDVYNRNKVFQLMQNWAYQKEKLILCITHDLNNLTDLHGYILNLSRPDAGLCSIDEKNVKEEIRFLERKL